jgi:hypothetical protein
VNVIALIGLYKDKDKRAMHKMGWIDDSGNLTQSGQSVFLNYLIENEDNRNGMGDLARTMLKEKIHESEEED